MEKEIHIAVKLWSDHIKGGKQDMGDGMGDAFASLAKRLAGPITDEQMDIFEKELAESLRKLIVESETWDLARPEWGAGRRNLGTDYNPDKELGDACNKAGINWLHIPIKSQT